MQAEPNSDGRASGRPRMLLTIARVVTALLLALGFALVIFALVKGVVFPGD